MPPSHTSNVSAVARNSFIPLHKWVARYLFLNLDAETKLVHSNVCAQLFLCEIWYSNTMFITVLD